MHDLGLGTVPMTPGCSFNAVEQQLQLFRSQASACAFTRGPAESSAFQALGAEPQTGPIPEKQFDAGASSICKTEQMPAQRLLGEDGLHVRVERVETRAHINRI